ncbi:DUF3995 domain-containing protein [Marinigracilibium pacificum]|uniref:DUF3995 domain-containing protein n=1 Tax=Marinigracilibium pacificum TaxID=2729599 RepID=A0A848J5B3_9BACT|nr:DUF3995 domain-containing protein [Marinigracilibium pacificum]NMM50665.1 DUF3995 domain-containing protein [Marinigracilibium pacificum]
MILSITLSIIFLSLGIIHFNWVLGGEFGFSASLPTNEKGERVLNPKRLESAIVGIGLTAFGLFYFTDSGLINIHLPNWVTEYGGWIIPSIFILRAIGEFKYVGFFKKIKNTEFAKWDTKLFSPLSLLIGLLGIIIQIS